MDIAPVIRTYISQELLHDRRVVLRDDTPLLAQGYLDSLQTVELVLFLEQRFGVRLEPEEVNERNFDSVQAIATLVAAKLESP